MKDSYQTLSAPSTGDFKDRGSKFLAYAWPIRSELEVPQHLEYLRKLHPKARHHCYAYRLGLDLNNFRANDDGEPSGTAGKPILGQIDSFSVTNVLIVVVRYFGGTLLGTSGLINAYRASAQDALQNADIVEQLVEEVYRLDFGYEIMPDVMNAVKKLQIKILKQTFEEAAILEIAIRKGNTALVFNQMKAQIAKVSLEEAELMKELPGLTITYLFTS